MWSKLEKTDLWERARTAHAFDSNRKYHNFDHVLRLYYHAEHTFALEYDRALDLAILAHDVIYDAQPDKELRSADWLLENATGLEHRSIITEAMFHIFKTVSHVPSSDDRMILLDLADLMFEDKTEENFWKIRDESKLLYRVNDKEFAEANIKFMTELQQRLNVNVVDYIEEDFLEIQRGIIQTKHLAHQLITH